MQISKAANLVWSRVTNLASNLRAPEPAQIQDLPAQELKDWTVLVYMEGRHRLAHSTDLGINKLEQLGSSPHVHIAVQATQAPAWQERILDNMQSLPTRRYHIQRDNQPGKISSPVVAEFQGQQSLTEDNLADFIAWGQEKFPSKHTMVIIKKHGAGFASLSRDGEVMAPLSARETETALRKASQRTGKKVDVVAFDSCSMQQMEVAYQLRKQASVMTGSEEDILAITYPYANLVSNLDKAPEVNAKGAGRLLVATYADKVKKGMHSAADLTALEGVAARVHDFTQAAIQSGVSRARLYTSMLDTRSMERTHTLALQHNFRDLGGFLARVANDSNYSVELRQKASQAAKALDEAVLARFADPGQKLLKEPTGLTGFLPWRELSPQMHEAYNNLDWAKDSGMGRLIDYIFEDTGSKAAPQVGPKPDLSLTQRFGRWGLYQYKKYISPYLNVTCAYTPTCSQFAREAIEQHGLWEGGKIGALRFFSCNGAGHGHDPLKGHVCDSQCHHHQSPALAQTLVEPMRNQVSPESFERHKKYIGLAQKAGLMIGGVGLAALSIPFGAAVGAWTGYQAGSGQIQSRVEEMAARYNPSVVRGFLNVAEPLGGPAARLHEKLPFAKRVLGGLAGAAMGLTMGTVGAAWQGFNWGKTFGGLWAGNRLADALGHLPAHPETETILRQDYQTASA
ncbi:MAG: membrane protein insertion efficiency factor YidD [Vulcanimicrobiota bacterium]